MTYCDYCGFRSDEPEGYRRNFCDNCVKDKEVGKGFMTAGKVRLVDMQVSTARIDELERRVILPYEKDGGGYFVGRRGENGEIQEREPDYR